MAAGADKTIRDLEGIDFVEFARIRGHDVALALFNGESVQSKQDGDLKENDKESKLSRHIANEEFRKIEELNQVKESKNARRKCLRNQSKVKFQTPIIPLLISFIPTIQTITLHESNEENEVQEERSYIQDWRKHEDGIKYLKSADSDFVGEIKNVALKKIHKKYQQPLSEKGIKLLALASKHLRRINRLLDRRKSIFGDHDELTSGLFGKSDEIQPS